MTDKRTITITFGDQAENHKGMQIIGTASSKGFSFEEMEEAKKKFEDEGAICQMIHLNEYLPEDVKSDKDAYVLIVHNWIQKDQADALMREQLELTYDSKAFMYGRVVNKHARHNLCFSDFDQEAEYAEGRGTVVNYERIPILKELRSRFGSYIQGGEDLAGEANFYYDISKCGIGYHGDSERVKVIALRLGASLPMHYHWFHKGEAIGRHITFDLQHGSMYIMSEKAVGTDWKKKIVPTLRHATGCSKFTDL